MALTLGAVDFTDDEAPESIVIGGEQAVAVRKYPGGQLDIQTLGAFDDPISWDGVLWFQDALARMAFLNSMRIDGLPVTLQIGSLSVEVVVTKFKATYLNDFRIPYHIEVQPTAVMNMQPGGASQSGAPTVGLSGVIGSVVGGIVSGGVTPVQSAMTPSDLANSASVPPAYATANEFSSAQAAPVGAILNQMSPATAAVVNQALNTASQVTHLVVSGETLWAIAAKYYASGAQWTQIAAANNIQDPVTIMAGQQLIIPNPTQVLS